MSEIDLSLLTKIREKGKTQRKTTSLYRVTSEPNTMKYRLIIKQYTFDVDIDKPYLLKTQFQKIGGIKAVNMIKDVQISRFDDKWKVLIIEKYQRNGELTGKIVPDQKIDVEFLKALAQGVQQLHKYHFMHLNLKPQNIFINSEKIVKFTDLQIPYLSSLFHKDKKTRQISNYLPPQAGQDHIVCQKWDVWSLGVIFLQLITNQFTKPQKQPLESLNKIIDTVKDQYLKQLIKRMICKRQQRMNIQEVLDCLNKGIQYFDHKESRIQIVSINIDLFTQAPCFQPIRKYLQYQNIHRKINNWILCITLIHLQSKKHQLWISLQNQSKSIPTRLNYLYSSMTHNIKKYFKDWQHFFNELNQTKAQDFQLDKDGFLRIKMKVKIQQKKQQMKQLLKTQVLEQKKSKNYIIEQIKSVNQQKLRQEKKLFQNNVREQHLMKKVPKNQQKHELILNELNLVFDSDQEADIKQAFRSFPNLNEAIEDNKSNLEWAVKIQAKEIGIISALYEQLGNSYDDYGDFQFAKRSYKIARQGYINQSGQNCEKEMSLLINLGNIYAKLSQFQKSIKCFKKCALIASKLKDIETEVIAYKNLGNVAVHNKDTNAAQMCYVKCLKIIQKMQNGPKQELPIIYTNLSNVYLMNEQYKKSNECIQEYMRIVPKKTGLKAGVLYFNWGFGLLHLNQFIEAFSKFEITFKQNYKDNMRARIEKIMLSTLRQKQQLIKRQQQHYIQAIVRVRRLLLSQNQRILDSIIDGNMA